MIARQSALLIALLCAVASTAAHADGSGTFTSKGQVTVLSNAYAYRHPDFFDKTKQVTTVMFSDKKIDAAKVNQAADRDDEVKSQLRAQQAARVELNIRPDGSVQNVNTWSNGTSGSMSGSGWYKIDLKQNDDKRIEGTFRSTDEKDKKEGSYYDLKFALNLPAPPNLGTLLPADGGEPGKAYRAYNHALQKGDVDTMAKYAVKERAGEMQAHRKDPDFKTMMGFMQESAIKDPQFGKSYINGDNATLAVSGKDKSGTDIDGTVTMVKEDGTWRIAKESTTAHMH